MSTSLQVTTVLGEDIEYEQMLRSYFRVYWTVWMISAPVWMVAAIAGSRGWPQWAMCALAYAGLGLLALSVARIFFGSQLILDHERQELMLRRRFLFFVSYKPLMGAEELWGTTWAGELPQAPFTWWWEYVALVITREGRRFRALRSPKDSVPAENRARGLSEQLGVPFHAGKEGHRLEVIPMGPQLSFKRVPVAGLDLMALIYWGFLIIPGMMCMLYGLTLPFHYGF